jgi:hypothetical protein
MLEKILLDYRKYNNFLKGKEKIDWYMIKNKISNLSSDRVNDKTNNFNEILYHLLNEM